MRINDKTEEIEKYLQELSEIVPESFEEYKKNMEKKRACERYIEIIIEAAVDLAFLVIKQKGWRIPKEDSGAFYILSENNIISLGLAKKLDDAKGMRNILAHEYGEVDDEKVFEAVKNELVKDVREFLELLGKAV